MKRPLFWIAWIGLAGAFAAVIFGELSDGYSSLRWHAFALVLTAVIAVSIRYGKGNFESFLRSSPLALSINFRSVLVGALCIVGGGLWARVANGLTGDTPLGAIITFVPGVALVLAGGVMIFKAMANIGGRV